MSHDGTASLGLSGIEIDLGPGEPKRVWHYAGLHASEPVRPNAIDVLLTSRDEPGASLFVQGHDFAARLREFAPHLSYRSVRGRRLGQFLLLATMLAVLILVGFAAGWSPIKSVAKTLPENWRQRLGNAARESMTAPHKQCVDADGVTALTHLTERLAKNAPPGTAFNVRVYDWDLMNAFAVPGGQIVLTKGLLEKAETADEVAGVLGHEMGHGIELHPETAILRGIGLATAVQVMLGGGAGGGLANVGLMLAQLGYSRDAERQADQRALELLKEAGIAPKGLGNFFVRVMKMEAQDPSGGNSDAFTWLHTHPPVTERVALVRRQTDYPATPALDVQSWQELKAICKTTAAPEKTEDDG
ncbi:M48 family metallopeptidase [Hyphomicrobium sp.]|uniref:M48 family metallopeptidase n=1 Tax=Hyphomicrobium sp. TaxID=82 RepID=UPI002C2C3182|nr:M48 family metallopeptidase [Hyphomicrobium sp.]HVZ04254.1 M48 family metallopeptidase [Hyphomicrobium sp.]